MPDRDTEPPIDNLEISPTLWLNLSDGRKILGFYYRHHPCSDDPIWEEAWEASGSEEYIHPLVESWELAEEGSDRPKGDPVLQPNRYAIKTTDDFLKVPPDRLDACLEEFKHYLGSLRAMQNLFTIAGELLDVDAQTESEGFIWIDDGKQDATISVSLKESDRASNNLTHN